MSDDEVARIKARMLSQLEAELAHRQMAPAAPAGVVEASDGEVDDLVQRHDVVFVDAWAPWCSPCRSFAPVYEEAAERFRGRALFLKINVDENPGLSARYNIQGIPTLLAFKGGRLIDQRAGAMPGAMFGEYVSRVLAA